MDAAQGMRMIGAGVVLLACLGTGALAAESASKLRKQMDKAENAYFALYNKLNTVREFDIICQTDRPTGTNMPVRSCQPRFLLNARQSVATEYSRAISSGGDASGSSMSRGAGGAPGAVELQTQGIADKQQALKDNMLAVLERSPELRALGEERDALQARHDAAVREAAAARRSR